MWVDVKGLWCHQKDDGDVYADVGDDDLDHDHGD
jgi:hypothetical protein